MKDKCIVQYQIATYSGNITVYCNPDDDNDRIKAKAKRQLFAKAGRPSMPMYHESFTIISRESVNE